MQINFRFVAHFEGNANSDENNSYSKIYLTTKYIDFQLNHKILKDFYLTKISIK